MIDKLRKQVCITFVQHNARNTKSAPSLNGAGNRTRTGDPQLGRLTL